MARLDSGMCRVYAYTMTNVMADEYTSMQALIADEVCGADSMTSLLDMTRTSTWYLDPIHLRS